MSVYPVNPLSLRADYQLSVGLTIICETKCNRIMTEQKMDEHTLTEINTGRILYRLGTMPDYEDLEGKLQSKRLEIGNREGIAFEDMQWE